MLDLLGNVSLSLQVAILFLLILGLPIERGFIGKKNFIKHGYLTIVALVLHTILIFVVMVPSFANGLGDLGSLSFLASFDVWSHVVLGSVAEVMGLIIIVVWLSKPLSMMRCAKLKKWMLPLFVIWVISLVNGSLLHILQLLE
jgi:hypothetical protein